MHVEVIDSLEGLDPLREAWLDIYSADAQTNYFTSWAYLRSWFQVTPWDWRVLVARQEPRGDPVGFLPLAQRVERLKGVGLWRELRMGGKPFADYTGFIIRPQNQDRALEAFGRHLLGERSWSAIIFNEVMDERLDMLSRLFQSEGCEVEESPSIVSPYCQLGPDWEEYMQEAMTAKSRYDFRRALKKVQKVPGLRESCPGPDDLDAHLDAMLVMWEARWGRLQSAQRQRFLHVFRSAFSSDQLWLKVLWDEDRAIAAVAAFVDPVKRAFLQYTTVYDPEYSKHSPGRALIGLAMQAAIAARFRVYDFLLGDEEYKYSFGATGRRTRSIIVQRRSLRGHVGKCILRARHRVSEALR